jgi:predicted RNA binding protein YcfA (HicA-like mRNA interferase family)
LKSVSGKDFARLLDWHGWELKRIQGSHPIYSKPGNPARLAVPIHGNSPLKIGLLRHLMKLANIDESEHRTLAVGIPVL